MDKFSDEVKDFIVEKASRGYSPEQIKYMLREEKDLAMGPGVDSIEEFIESGEGSEEVRIRESIREKKAEVSQEDLVEVLVDLKNDLETWREELKETEHGVTRNEAIKNTITVVNKIGELIGELDREGVAGNIIKIDEFNQSIQQNVTQVIQHLPKQQKKDVVEQLKEDDDVEHFAIKFNDGDTVSKTQAQS